MAEGDSKPSVQGKNDHRPFDRLTFVVAALVCLVAAAVVFFAYGLNRRIQRDKAAMGLARELATAADQYYLENGVSVVAYSNLVGALKYVRALNHVDVESYPAFYTRGMTITVSGVSGTRTVTYAP